MSTLTYNQPIARRPMNTTVKSTLSPDDLKEVVQQVLDLRRVSKITGFNTLHEIVAILSKLSPSDLIAVGRAMDLKPKEMPRSGAGR